MIVYDEYNGVLSKIRQFEIPITYNLCWFNNLERGAGKSDKFARWTGDEQKGNWEEGLRIER